MRQEDMWLRQAHWDTLKKYYEEHKEELQAKTYVNFHNWLGALTYMGFIENEKINKVRHELMRIQTTSSSLGLSYSIGSFDFRNLVKNLWKAIDDNDPRTVKCEKCNDICRSWSTPNGECPPQEAEF